MVLKELKANIMADKFESVYMFTGDEIEVQKIYINEIARRNKLKVKRADSISSVQSLIFKKSMFSAPNCWVIRDDLDIISSNCLQELILNPDLKLNKTILILLFTKLDKRSSFYKKYVDRIVVFDFLQEKLLVKYIKHLGGLNSENAKDLAQICENNYGRILNELDKLNYIYNKSHDEIYVELRESGGIYRPPYDAIFDLVDAVVTCQPTRAFRLLADCEQIGESKLAILSVLYNNFRQILQVQSCCSNDVVKSTGLTAWQVKCAKNKVGYYSNDELVQFLESIREVETGIKTGKIEERIALPYLFCLIF